MVASALTCSLSPNEFTHKEEDLFIAFGPCISHDIQVHFNEFHIEG